MTNGIVSIRKNGVMLYKAIVGHDGQNAPKVASRVMSMAHIPTVDELAIICAEEDFGCAGCIIILENNPDDYYKPKILKGKEVDWDDDNPEYQRYFDTFYVAEFNPRWKFGTAPYVEVIDVKTVGFSGPNSVTETTEPEIRHLWTDEEVEKLKAKGVISTEPFTEAIPASTPGTCVYCNTPTGDESSVCKDCEFPF